MPRVAVAVREPDSLDKEVRDRRDRDGRTSIANATFLDEVAKQ